MAFDWKSTLSAIAPTVATALGGPLAGLAVAQVGKALGMDAPTVQKVQDALTQGQLSGDQIEALKQAELGLQEKLRELDIQEETLTFTDRDSARKREEVVKDATPSLLASGITLGFFGILAYLLFSSPPAGSRDILNIMLGSLGTAWMGCISYYFGSSAGSDKKTDLLIKGTNK